MKKLIAFLLVIMLPAVAVAQKSLPDSKRHSDMTQIFRLDERQVRDLFVKDAKVDEKFLTTRVGEFPYGGETPELPRGNYLLVSASEDGLAYDSHTVDDLQYTVSSDNGVVFRITDNAGTPLEDVRVRLNGGRLKYDRGTKTYGGKLYGSGSQLAEIENRGVFHYVTIEKPRVYRRGLSAWLDKVAQCFGGDSNPKDDHTGFVVFSKPRYKPGETVRLKAWVTDLAGKPVNRPLDLRLVMGYVVDSLLTRVEPYRPGAFEYDFTLSDSLRIKLDRNYNIVLTKPGERKKEYLRGYFRYEDYELKAITFSATTPKNSYTPGDTVRVFLNAADENGMAVYDGQVTVTVTPGVWNVEMHTDEVFVPQTVWKHTVPLIDASRKEVVIPDSVFIRGASLDYSVGLVYLDASNERHNRYLSLEYDNSGYSAQFMPTDKGLEIAVRHNGVPIPTRALLTAFDENDTEISRDSITLPSTIVPLPTASYYKLIGNGIDEEYEMYEYTAKPLVAEFRREGKDINLKVGGNLGYGFSYRVERNGHEIARGYSYELDYRHPANDRSTYTATVSYVFAGAARNESYTIEPVRRKLTIDVATPASVYPGQKTEVGVSVKDSKGRPVPGADVTAYAHISKFGAASPAVPYYDKIRKGNVDYTYIEPSPLTIDHARSSMTWGRWRTEMGLDSVEYYRFLNPEPVYISTVDTPDGRTQIAPFISVDGELQGAQTVWINRVPVYMKQAGQMAVYSFPVDNAKTLTIRLRTYDREVTITGVTPAEGKKTVISVDGSVGIPKYYGDMRVGVSDLSGRKGKDSGRLRKSETDEIMAHMVSIERMFDYKSLKNRYLWIEDPYFIESAGTLYYLNPPSTTPSYRMPQSGSIVVGPFFYRMPPATLYRFDRSVNGFSPEGGTNYTLFENYTRTEKWGHNRILSGVNNYKPSLDFRQTALTFDDIQALYRSGLGSVLRTAAGLLYFRGPEVDNNKDYRMQLRLYGSDDRSGTAQNSTNVAMVIFDNRPDTLTYVYGGSDLRNIALPRENWNMTVVFDDFSHYTRQIALQPDGTNILKLSNVKPVRDTAATARILEFVNDHILTEVRAQRPVTVESGRKYKPWPGFVSSTPDPSLAKDEIAGVVTDDTGMPIIGATITVSGIRDVGAVTDHNGQFRLRGDHEGKSITVSSLGMMPLSDAFHSGRVYRFIMVTYANSIENLAIVNSIGSSRGRTVRGSGKQISLGYSASFDTVLEEDVAMETRTVASTVPDIWIRGANSLSAGNTGDPLIIINGMPATKEEMAKLKPNEILSLSVLKDASATEIYGSRGANGVIVVTTGSMQSDTDGETDGGMSLRRNFHDDAFWQPRLRTDAAGKASFEVTYPDDITNWSANFLAVTAKKQSGQRALSIASYKALSARLTLPRFAIEGDRINAIGRLSNYQGDTVSIRQGITIDGREEERTATLARSQVDTIALVAARGDSVRVKYTLTTPNGYFDGEERAMPVYARGTLETFGEFEVVGDGQERTYSFDPSRGKVTVHAEASSFEVFMREIAKVDEYPYLCNEQMASKLVALLEKKALCEAFGVPFKEEGKITRFIDKLTANANGDGLWGWWNRDATVKWISNHVLRALLQAEKSGYTIRLDREGITRTLTGQVSTSSGTYYQQSDRRTMIDNMSLLTDLGADIPYGNFISLIDTVRANTLADNLAIMKLKADHKIPFVPDSLMQHSQRTMMGGLYWGQTRRPGIQLGPYILLPNDNSVERTLDAYAILKSLGGHEDELGAIRSWFFEQRKGDGWANTYQSARILQTIIPDMAATGERPGEVTATINGQSVSKFPYTGEFDASQITLQKNGTAPLFFTAYQQEWNSEPERAAEGFTVRSSFRENADTVAVLTAGRTVWLDVTVVADSDAEYVMIEVPIPAGCSYESKGQLPWREAHREHYKDRVSIFCNKLQKGESRFSIELIPRFTGAYHLNPARTELMYFPTFYGREQMKKVNIVYGE